MFLALLKTMRPHQWVKNLFVILPLVFAHGLFGHEGNVEPVIRTVCAFFIFCFTSGTVYILNDIVDVERDRLHPTKRNRPIASGRVPIPIARGAGGVLLVFVLVAAGLLGLPFFAVVAGYLGLNLAYSLRLKQIAYLDVACIATGFELRVLGGALATPVPPTAYLLLVTALLASFLGFGKRLHELMQGDGSHEQRSVLRAYNIGIVTGLMVVASIATVSTYAAYTFDARTRALFGTDYLPVTTMFTLFGIVRFLHLARCSDPRSPTDRMLRDPWFLVNLGLWATTVCVLIYTAG